MAPVIENFTQHQPATGAPARFRTEVRLMYDEDNLYIGAINFDPDPAAATVNEITETSTSDLQTSSALSSIA